MPKRYLSGEEWYPVLVLAANGDNLGPDAVEFSVEELADLIRVGSEFIEWQKKIAERFGMGAPHFVWDKMDDGDGA